MNNPYFMFYGCGREILAYAETGTDTNSVKSTQILYLKCKTVALVATDNYLFSPDVQNVSLNDAISKTHLAKPQLSCNFSFSFV